MSEKELSEKHKTFIDLYFSNGKDSAQAYKEAGYKCKEEYLYKQSQDLLKKLEKNGYFLEKYAENRKKLDELHGVNRDFLINELKECLVSAKTGDEILTENGSYTKIDRQAWLKAVDQLCKMTGEYAETKAKLQISGTGENGALQVETKIILN